MGASILRLGIMCCSCVGHCILYIVLVHIVRLNVWVQWTIGCLPLVIKRCICIRNQFCLHISHNIQTNAIWTNSLWIVWIYCYWLFGVDGHLYPMHCINTMQLHIISNVCTHFPSISKMQWHELLVSGVDRIPGGTTYASMYNCVSWWLDIILGNRELIWLCHQRPSYNTLSAIFTTVSLCCRSSAAGACSPTLFRFNIN